MYKTTADVSLSFDDDNDDVRGLNNGSARRSHSTRSALHSPVISDDTEEVELVFRGDSRRKRNVSPSQDGGSQQGLPEYSDSMHGLGSEGVHSRTAAGTAASTTNSGGGGSGYSGVRLEDE